MNPLDQLLRRRARFELGRRLGPFGRRVSLDEGELFRHMLLVGTTGSGKTTAGLAICEKLIERGWGVVMIDLKGDPQNATMLERATQRSDVAYQQFSTTPGLRRDAWQPLGTGDANARMSRVICLCEWSEPYYRSVCERFCQLAFALIERAGIEPAFGELIGYLDRPGSLLPLTAALDTADRERANNYLLALSKDKAQRSGLAGLAARLGTLCDVDGPLYGVE